MPIIQKNETYYECSKCGETVLYIKNREKVNSIDGWKTVEDNIMLCSVCYEDFEKIFSEFMNKEKGEKE